MRLINVHTMKVEEFFTEQLPPYAVVSHRWGAREVNLQEYLSGRNAEGPGYEKIVKTSAIAKARGRDYVWLDTCCIDKTSSAELTEAINSMYMWYQRAEECYAVLPDVPHSEDKAEIIAALPNSAWFTRGWTLQELLAPREVYFYDANFEFFASKAELADELCKITGIRGKFMKHQEQVIRACVAEKFSWMSRRQTTRIEDTAYCMIGLFGVNMPLLYGEEEKAFFRLQLEILRTTDDESIYAWASKDQKVTGMLASWPTDFASSGSIRKFIVQPEHRVPWHWTNKGLEVRLVETRAMLQKTNFDPMPVGQPEKLITLGCWKTDDPLDDNDNATERRIANKIIAIELKRKGTAWQRTNSNAIQTVNSFNVVSRLSTTPLALAHYFIPQEDPEYPVLW